MTIEMSSTIIRYQAHRFDPDVPIEETIEAFQQVVASGKAARYLGSASQR
jgi:aryl-alcohol dehydrogenase-like predicted oxidoreductase